MIKVGEMVRRMRKTVGLNKPRPFSIIYATANRKKKTGGEFRELHKAILLTKKRAPGRILKLQPLGTNDIITVHLDLILYFENEPVA